MVTYPYIYVYATNRDDGWAYAVGIIEEGLPADGGVGLFAELADAALFAESLGAKYPSATVSVVPGSEA